MNALRTGSSSLQNPEFQFTDRESIIVRDIGGPGTQAQLPGMFPTDTGARNGSQPPNPIPAKFWSCSLQSSSLHKDRAKREKSGMTDHFVLTSSGSLSSLERYNGANFF